MQNFEPFKRTNARPTPDPTVTVSKRGTLNLNLAAFELLGQPDAVQLLYARDERTIGLRPAGRDDPDTYLVRSVGRPGTTWMLSGKSFCRHIGTDLSTETRRYPLALDDGVGCVDLKQPGTVVTSNRTRPI